MIASADVSETLLRSAGGLLAGRRRRSGRTPDPAASAAAWTTPLTGEQLLAVRMIEDELFRGIFPPSSPGPGEELLQIASSRLLKIEKDLGAESERFWEAMIALGADGRWHGRVRYGRSSSSGPGRIETVESTADLSDLCFRMNERLRLKSQAGYKPPGGQPYTFSSERIVAQVNILLDQHRS